MPGYIDKDALIKTTEEVPFTMSMCVSVEECNGMNRARKLLIEAFKILPAADVVPVVRCSECELWNDWDHSGRKELGNFVCSCAHWSNEDGYVVYTKPDDYCSYGDPKE